jgi:hypothetical protein
VLLREVVEGQEAVSIPGEAAARRLVLGTLFFQEVVKGLGRHLPGLGQPDLVKFALRLRLEGFGHLVGVRSLSMTCVGTNEAARRRRLDRIFELLHKVMLKHYSGRLKN